MSRPKRSKKTSKRKYKRVTFDVTDLNRSDDVSEGKDWDGADLAGVNPGDWGDEQPHDC